MTTRPEDEDALPAGALDTVLESFEAPVPPADFANRVMAARAAGSVPAVTTAPPSRWRARGALVVAAAAGALLAVGGPLVWPGVPHHGVLDSAGTQEALVGDRATVAALDARLEWDVAANGETRVNQTRGRVFYRVERGGPFEVVTPAGTVTVHGTSFEVELLTEEKNMASSLGVLGKGTLVGALGGAALAAAVVVTVYEGKVALANAGGVTHLTAGQTAVAQPGQVPRGVASKVSALEADKRRLASERDSLRTQVEEMEEQVKRMTLAAQDGKSPLASENEALRAQLKNARENLAAERAAEAARAGQATPWPETLPERYKQDGMQQAFNQALAAAGIDGDIKSIDCTEFPCIVFGQINNGTKEQAEADFKKFDAALRQQFPEDGHSMHESAWSRSKKGPDGKPTTVTHFGVSVYPEDVVSKEGEGAVSKRSRFRTQSYMDSELGN